jgi:hypothetical protein
MCATAAHIDIVRADELRVGDIFSTDGYRVTAAVLLSGGGADDEVAVHVELNGHSKFAYLNPDHPCPLWRT